MGKRGPNSSNWLTLKEWKTFGRNMNYKTRSSSSLAKSNNAVERSWYSRGQRMKWLSKFKLKTSSKNSGYWTKWENIESKLRVYEKKLGYIPTEKYLKERRQGGLIDSIQKKHGGFRKVRIRMNSPQIRFPSSYWKIWDNIVNALNHAVEELDHFPSSKELKKLGYGSVPSVISRYHGGMESVMNRMNLPSKKRIPGYWEKWDNVKKEIEMIWKEHPEKLDKVPSNYWLQKNNYSYLNSGIAKYHGSITKVRVRLGQEKYAELRQKYNKFITKAELSKGLKALWKEFPETKGTLPSDNWLREHGWVILSNAINKHHQGFVKTRQDLKLKPINKTKKGEFKNWHKCKRAIDKVYNDHPELDGLPLSQKFLQNNRYFGLDNSIRKHHGGLPRVREKIGYNESKRDELAQELESILFEI
jgi:hypothetical protein